jgi:hypothetical protein
MHNWSAFVPDLQNRDHVTLFGKLASFRFKLPSIRRILPNLVDDHVKLSLQLPCSDENTSNFAWNFLAEAQTRCDLLFV